MTSDLSQRPVPYPDVADVAHASAPAAAFFRSFFSAKSSKDIEATQAHFHPAKTAYFDATLGWAFTSHADVHKGWQQLMPTWPDAAKSYPTGILGDTTSGIVFMTDTPELFGAELRAIAVVDFEDGKIVRWVDYWDGRGSEIARTMSVPVESYPHELGSDAVTDRVGALADAARNIADAFGEGDARPVADLFTYDAVFEDMTLRSQIRGRAAIARYLGRALPHLPYAGASIRHIVGNSVSGGFEWRADNHPVPRGAVALVLDDHGQIAEFTAVWDGSLLDDAAITAAVACSVDR
ncbi:nuclear transport factor 2 family protein [Actinoplanes sp. NPDC051411]|uniref:nuclear transport factor 2 family protein n=1 Tax=Actinoplanes sp. NPDC051411 TaxID=3155522 RepID=UPI0034255401